MALQGNLHDFSAMEILQLLGSQKKTGCLVLEWNTERSMVWVLDGRVVSTRAHGMTKDDPLAAFLLQIHRLSNEQFRGLLTIQKESGRDLEDLLANGRYVEADELVSLVERQVLNDLSRLVRWENGTYRFDPNTRWPAAPLISLAMEAAIMEAARRVDEQKRFVSVFRDPHQLLGVHDLPDPSEPLSEEEREIFGIVDGQHTVAEVVKAAPLSEYEAYESLHRMLEAQWIEFVGHARHASARPRHRRVCREPGPRPALRRRALRARAGSVPESARGPGRGPLDQRHPAAGARVRRPLPPARERSGFRAGPDARSLTLRRLRGDESVEAHEEPAGGGRQVVHDALGAALARAP